MLTLIAELNRKFLKYLLKTLYNLMKIKEKELFDLRYRFDYINLSLISEVTQYSISLL